MPCATQNKDAVQLTLEQIDVIKRLVDKYPQYFQFATSVTGMSKEAHNYVRNLALYTYITLSLEPRSNHTYIPCIKIIQKYLYNNIILHTFNV